MSLQMEDVKLEEEGSPETSKNLFRELKAFTKIPAKDAVWLFSPFLCT